ncbi:hypothetical protein [Brevibacterium casei]|uniref:hypothetical protein n=1 Tax=Brevibacterium casei TaxID=33889 RepID=UPI00167C6017|nr:hypothetical protein [Brevibacterium casei]
MTSIDLSADMGLRPTSIPVRIAAVASDGFPRIDWGTNEVCTKEDAIRAISEASDAHWAISD